MPRKINDAQKDWINGWLDEVAAGRSTMSQRVLSSVEKHGGLAEARSAAKRRGVHLLLISNDDGRQLLAASLRPFKVIC